MARSGTLTEENAMLAKFDPTCGTPSAAAKYRAARGAASIEYDNNIRAGIPASAKYAAALIAARTELVAAYDDAAERAAIFAV